MPPLLQKMIDEPLRKVVQISGGVNFEHPAGDLPDNTLSDVLNLQYFKGICRADTGYQQYRQQVQGIPQAEFQFVAQNGAVQTLLLTTKFLYLDNGIEWQWVGDGVADTTLIAEVDSGNVFQVTLPINFVVGNSIGIILNDTTQFRTTVTGVAGTQITTAVSLPSGKVALAGAQVVRPPAFHGSIVFQPIEVSWPTLNSLIFTNGVDPIQIYNGTDCVPLPGWAGITARVLVAFHGFLTAFDTTENGTRFPQRARWSDQNNPETTGGLLGGFVDLTDTEDFIVAALILGPWLIIYRETSVMRRSYIGDPLFLFFDEYMLQGLGVFSQNAVADTGSTHIFAGPAGIFRYAGGYDAEDVGDPIFDAVFGPQGTITESAVALVTMFYIEELDEVWLMLPTNGNTTTLDTTFRFDQGNNAWWIRKFTDQLIGFGFVEAIPGRTWQQALLPWNQDTSTWISHAKAPSAPLLILCDPVKSLTYLYDFFSSQDNTKPYSWSLTTKDFESPEKKVRFDGVYAKGTGNGIFVEISLNRGQTFLPLGTLNFGLTFTQQQVNAQFVADAFRIRLSGNDPTFSLDWLRCDYFEESQW